LKKVLLVSPYPYSLSSRGMDVLTNCFDEEQWDVSHLTFPRMFITPTVSPPENSNVTCLQADMTFFPYIDRIMHGIPRILFNLIKFINNRTVKYIDFSSYDYIVLESGKPLFLMDKIPSSIPIIYRLSDSVQLVLGKNRTYRDLEKKVFEISNRMVFKKEVYKSFLEPHQKSKTTVIENGMVIPELSDEISPYEKNSKNAVYVGLHQLDFDTVKHLLIQIPGCQFHIIGPCLGKGQIQKLSRFENFHYYSFLTKEEYMPMLKWADLAIFPFKRTEMMKWFGLTSKFLHFMYFQLPIVSYPTGIDGEFDNLPVRFPDSKYSFADHIEEVLEEGNKIRYNLDFDYYSSSSRKEEYKRFIRTL